MPLCQQLVDADKGKNILERLKCCGAAVSKSFQHLMENDLEVCQNSNNQLMMRLSDHIFLWFCRMPTRFTCVPTPTTCPIPASTAPVASERRVPWRDMSEFTLEKNHSNVPIVRRNSVNMALSQGISGLRVRFISNLIFLKSSYRETLRVGDLFGQIRRGGCEAPSESDLPKQIPDE